MSSTHRHACKRQLLSLNGHGSHLSACCQYCHDNYISLLLLPLHTSHIPLDVDVFKELKKVICAAAEDRWWLLADGDCLSKRDLILDLAEAKDKAITGKPINKGWDATGIWPLNPDKVLPYPDPKTAVAALTPLAACR
jgi:hypothetical protein